MAEQSMQLKAEVRDNPGKESARKLRQAKRLPAVIYGPGLNENVYVSVDDLEFNKLFKQCSHHQKIELLVGKKKYKVVVKDIEIHPIKRSILHVDFLSLKAKTPFVTKVPLRFEGTPEGVKAGGTLFTYRFKLKVKQLPEKMVDGIPVDITNLQQGRYIIIRDIPAIKGVDILTHEGDVIAEVK